MFGGLWVRALCKILAGEVVGQVIDSLSTSADAQVQVFK